MRKVFNVLIILSFTLIAYSQNEKKETKVAEDTSIARLIIEKNPGIFSILLTAVILPLAILILTNWHLRKMKEIEKNIDLNFKSKTDLREQEKMVYASLSKILFDVQQLHVSLSGTCVDTSCIMEGLTKFDASVTKCHDDISNNMLYLSSAAINLVYGFYSQIGRLKITLKELDKRKEYSIANVTVYFASQDLADSLIQIQELFITQRSDLKIQFDKTKQERMKHCCGEAPPRELKLKYEELKKTLQIEHAI